MRKFLGGVALALAALPATANAAFIVNYMTGQPVVAPPAPSGNDFYQGLALNGITRFASIGALLVIDSPGRIKFEFFGNDALLANKFTAGPLSFSTATAFVNNFTVGPGASGTPQDLGTFNFTPANFNPTFFTNGAGPAITPGSPLFGIGLPDGAPDSNGVLFTNEVWLMFDDLAGNPDDNHDDLLIRATFAVPEPGTWMMMILGFGVIGLVMRRRSNHRVSFV